MNLKRITLILLLTTICIVVEAQNSNSSFGVKADANISKARNVERNKVIPGFSLGVFYNYTFTKDTSAATTTILKTIGVSC